VVVQQMEGVWQIVDIRCGLGDVAAPAAGAPGQSEAPDAEPAREGWMVYANGEYAFDLSYPADWTHQELVADPNQPPIGPEQVKAMTLLMPQAWAEAMASRQGPPDPNAPVIAPFTLEVVQGDEAALRQVYPEPTTREAMEIAGYAATREVEMINDTLSLVRYLVRHPGQPDIWLVVTDPISGFPDRVPGNEANLATFAEILATLRID
jgi:hypothetical protein